MSSQTPAVIPCLLSERAIVKIRQYIFHGTEGFADRAMDHNWLKETFGPTFQDIEIGISKEGYTCEKAPMLRPDEYATFVRITEKGCEPRAPRILTLGVVLSLTGQPSYPAQCRLWDECPRMWVGGDNTVPLAILNDEMEMGKVLNEVMTAFCYACVKPLKELPEESMPFSPSNASSGAKTGAKSLTPLMEDISEID